jgi:hypothetical protein
MAHSMEKIAAGAVLGGALLFSGARCAGSRFGRWPHQQ